MVANRATQLKEEGNRHFQAGDYDRAEGLYSQAILADPKNPTFYTNRALARIKLERWELVADDSRACLELDPLNMKAEHYLAQAQLALRDFDEAVHHAKLAHKLCLQGGNSFNIRLLPALTGLVLQCKQERCRDHEKRRKRERQDLERELVDLLIEARNRELKELGYRVVEDEGEDKEGKAHEGGNLSGDKPNCSASNSPSTVDDSERRIIISEWDTKIAHLHGTFEQARNREEREREVPSWLIDDITFNVMVDPVMTKNGHSYERAGIVEYLKTNPQDPMTREPLTAADLRPNLGLRQACEEFVDKNGWVIDW